MNKNELLNRISKESGMAKVKVARAVDSLIGTISGALRKKEKVTLVGFGTFKVIDRKARNGVNPKTGEKIRIKAARVPKFAAGKELKKLVNK